MNLNNHELLNKLIYFYHNIILFVISFDFVDVFALNQWTDEFVLFSLFIAQKL